MNGCYLARIYQSHDCIIVAWLCDRGPAEHYPLSLGNSDAFRLPPMDLDPLLLGYARHDFCCRWQIYNRCGYSCR